MTRESLLSHFIDYRHISCFLSVSYTIFLFSCVIILSPEGDSTLWQRHWIKRSIYIILRQQSCLSKSSLELKGLFWSLGHFAAKKNPILFLFLCHISYFQTFWLRRTGCLLVIYWTSPQGPLQFIYNLIAARFLFKNLAEHWLCRFS